MEKIKVEIMNCYGINKLKKEFDLTGNKSTHVIYAPNGVMKTSFANVFDDYSKGTESRDLIYSNRVSVRAIKDSDENDIEPESIFVIRPYERGFKSDKMSTLLVKEELREKYTEIHKKIDVVKDKLIKELSKLSGLKKNIEEELAYAFTRDKNSFLLFLEELEEELSEDTLSEYSHIVYKIIFDEKVVAFLETGDIKQQIKKYIEKYDELINASTFLKKEFNHYNANTVHKNLTTNGFFKAQHTINLNLDGNMTEIKDEQAFLKLIKDEQEKILNNSSLQIIFNSIDKKITTAQLRNFRDYLFDNQEILTELVDLSSFRKKLWISYLRTNKDIYQDLIQEYKKGQVEIKKLIEEAKNGETDWENVIDIFNRRFYVPYTLSIKNKEDTILRNEAPSIHYFFKDREESVESVNEDILLSVLSQGETRALYLLNIIFEIESRKKQGIKTLFIVDDIADSFDYKNKYAIIEYLKDVSESSNFFSIILTHNFDFFRTVQDRIIGNSRYTNSYMAIKEKDEIYLEKIKYKYFSNPFTNWKKNLDNDVKLLASVTFARNIAEYIGDADNFNKLTSVLHIKSNTKTLTIRDLEDIFKSIFKDLEDLTLENQDKKVYDLILDVADEICNAETELGLNIENKVVLSIAIRLNAETYMINKINDKVFVSGIKNYQTGRLFGKFKELYSNEFKSIGILEKVNLMTPENIHLNSFMYEPILDISDYHLKSLYKEVLQLITMEELSTVGVAATLSNE
ncbi:hypothetical protein ABEP50_22600 [Priestia megaterium]